MAGYPAPIDHQPPLSLTQDQLPANLFVLSDTPGACSSFVLVDCEDDALYLTPAQLAPRQPYGGHPHAFIETGSPLVFTDAKEVAAITRVLAWIESLPFPLSPLTNRPS